MARLNVLVEGQTEETFIKNLLAPHLGLFHVYAVARSVETSRRKRKIYRGGMIDYGRTKRDILRWMKEDPGSDVFLTTMFDLYALPEDFPKFTEARKYSDPYQRITILESALGDDILSPRLIPHIQLHEFETLIFCDPDKIKLDFFNRESEVSNLVKMCSEFSSPELIDDDPEKAPSKRIIKEIPEYEGRKASAGPHLVQEIGLPNVRAKCVHFDAWLKKLEGLGQT
jgi:hypothetical protein